MMKCSPQITPRYWGAIMLASMCGTNLGDFFPDMLKMDLRVELVLLAGLFGGIFLVDRFLKRGIELLYWVTILVVRAAATALADYCTSIKHFAPEIVGISLAALMVVAILVEKSAESSEVFQTGDSALRRDKPAAGLHYWTTMLVAGTLGTVVGDGIGHAFSSPEIGFPFSALLATVAVAAMFTIRAQLKWSLGPSYWIAIVAVRWWGANTGDIFKYLTSLPFSMAVTAAAMTAMLTLAPNQRNGKKATS